MACAGSDGVRRCRPGASRGWGAGVRHLFSESAGIFPESGNPHHANGLRPGPPNGVNHDTSANQCFSVIPEV